MATASSGGLHGYQLSFTISEQFRTRQMVVVLDINLTTYSFDHCRARVRS